MTYIANILADSMNPTGVRLTTFEVQFPRMVLADFTRHRCFSYSFESTRAVPVEKRIETVRSDPFTPKFRTRVMGMAMGEFLTGPELKDAEYHWRKAAEAAADQAERLLDVEKGLAGRLLEPFLWITGIVTGTDWDNFFNLRCHPSAQYELQVLAKMMRAAHRFSFPQQLKAGEWHLPLVTDKEKETYNGQECAYISAGRGASVSFMRHHDPANDSTAASTRWHMRLAPSNHWSPGEHPAQAFDGVHYIGNVRGFKQLRKFYPGNEIARTPA